jgi:hypothetical protein
MAFSVHVHLKANLAQDEAMKLAEQIAPAARTYKVGDIITYDAKRYRISRIERIGQYPNGDKWTNTQPSN